MENRIEKILIAPLDWGLGHATRCIPLIRLFLLDAKEVVIASSGKALKLLQEEFPALEFIELPAYDIHYKFDSMTLNMMFQLPKLRAVILKENRAINRIIKEKDFDLIISDNRYGVHHPNVPSVFIGHQLAIQMPKHLQLFSSLTFKWHAKMLEVFNQIWVPDFADDENLSGDLSHHLALKNTVFFIGPLSRFNSEDKASKKINVLIILSGQEPQRSELEHIILNQITEAMHEVVLVRGLPNSSESLKYEHKKLKVYNHLSAQNLEGLIADSSLVVSRSGYSSIMDMAAMQKRVLFIPTPGQTEQEYLADYLMKKGRAFAVAQKDLDLSNDLKTLSKYKPLDMKNLDLEAYIKNALNKL